MCVFIMKIENIFYYNPLYALLVRISLYVLFESKLCIRKLIYDIRKKCVATVYSYVYHLFIILVKKDRECRFSTHGRSIKKSISDAAPENCQPTHRNKGVNIT